MGIVLALAAAAAYGVSDFVGGVASRRTSAWPVAVLAGLGGLTGALCLAVVLGGEPRTADLAWAAVAGVGAGAGSVFLYRGLATGRMGVVAPVSAVGAAILPVLVAVATGERPVPLVWAGILLALPAIWLVARTPPSADDGPSSGLLDGLLAGLGFGLLFVAIGQVRDEAGLWPLALVQGAGMATIVLFAAVLGERWLPSHRVEAWGFAAGMLAAVAQLLFLLSAQTGLLTVAAVITSLYPAFTVLLAALALREPIFRTQALGLALSATAVVLIASS